MEALHLIYQHWFLTILLGGFVGVPLVGAFGICVGNTIRAIRAGKG